MSSRSPEEFDAMYAGTPPWEIGGPQPAMLALAESGRLQGRLLDLGCGTGEHVLMAAGRGLEATGIDAAPNAIARARAKAAERQLSAEFILADVLELEDLGRRFDTVIDSGLFHVFDDADRTRYVETLRSVLAPGGHAFILCFSDAVPGEWGPRRVSQEELRTTFAPDGGWRVESIQPASFRVIQMEDAVAAWLTEVTRP